MNLKNAFQVCRPARIANKRILIVDDVSTTGATVSEAAKVVRKAGASYIAVMVLALRSK
ncbi:MAG: ComF family protein [Desulfomonilaceae bacterium]